jgi:hypothetical protein
VFAVLGILDRLSTTTSLPCHAQHPQGTGDSQTLNLISRFCPDPAHLSSLPSLFIWTLGSGRTELLQVPWRVPCGSQFQAFPCGSLCLFTTSFSSPSSCYLSAQHPLCLPPGPPRPGLSLELPAVLSSKLRQRAHLVPPWNAHTQQGTITDEVKLKLKQQ